ncbi:MAG: cysteinyl-tRNA synthetase [Patescibacteria group bacterium]|jgi:cysteinyl-tRNA synthetase|nr:cysteinyl-tRNA synthetase [Patescibacteria group bacterium]
MALNLYNTKTKTIDVFTPLNGNIVTLYACGPTVYDYTHIGHMRKYIGDDLLCRTLSYLGYDVKHVMNITDVGHLTNDSDEGDDKFEGKAMSEGKSVWDIAKLYTDYFHESMRAINVLPPNTKEAKATEHIPQMISLVEKLIAKGHAYETAVGIYFDTQTFKDYGSLSGQKLSEKEIGARDDVVVDKEKKHPADFVLWFKRVGRFAQHSMYWPSPWGEGFPGWHIECSAMSMHYLGETIDIHTGGIDHIPVHHENEIAQSECSTGHDFVRFWVHHAFLNVDGEKMSKSKHNFYTISDIEGHNINPLSMRLLAMQTSYRKPLNFTWEALSSADLQLKKLQKFASKKELGGNITDEYKKEFIESISEDLNFAKALAVVWKMLADENTSEADKYATLISFDEVLGLNLSSVPEFSISDEAKNLLEKMKVARENKDYTTSDAIRAELEKLGYKVEQSTQGIVLS